MSTLLIVADPFRLLALVTLTLSLAPAMVGGCNSSDGAQPATAPATQPATNPAPPRASDARRQYPLDGLPSATISVKGHTLRVWLAQEFDSRRPEVVQEGLMFVPTAEIADDQGMLFVFNEESVRGFWMKNTVAPLDIAFARFNGTIVKTWQMPVLTLRTFSSVEPAMFALELKQGTLARIGVKQGDRLEIPASVLKPQN